MELRNPLSRYQLDQILKEVRPLPLVGNFTWSDVGGGSLSLGDCPAGHLINKTIIEIVDAFDGGTQITVGDSGAQARLQAIADNVPSEENFYERNNSYEYAAKTEIFVFFPGGTPTTGSGRALVYLD